MCTTSRGRRGEPAARRLQRARGGGLPGGTKPVRDVASNDAANPSGESVTNHASRNTAASALAATDPAVVPGRALTLAWTVPLEPARVADKSANSVSGDNQSVESVAVRGPHGEQQEKNSATNALCSVQGFCVAGYCRQADANPGNFRQDFRGVSVTERQGHLESDQALSRGTPPRPDDFRVTGAGSGQGAGSARTARSMAAIAVVGAELSVADRDVVLTLGRAAVDGERLTVRYVPPHSGAGLGDGEGNQVAASSVETVVGPAAPTVTGLAVVSDAGDGAGRIGRRRVKGHEIRSPMARSSDHFLRVVRGTPRETRGTERTEPSEVPGCAHLLGAKAM